MVPLDLWISNVNATNSGKSDPVTTIVASKSDVDQILNDLGVVQRGRRGRKDDIGAGHSGCGGNARRVASSGATVHKPKSKIGLQPKDLRVEDLLDLAGGEVKYQEIMELYHFESVRYFKEIIKPLGYRLLRGELWVV